MRNNAMLLHSRAILRAGINLVRKSVGAEPLAEKVSVRGTLKEAGQVIVVFVLMLTVLIGLMGIAVDATYAWREALRVQRAADAASLAGVVYMPGNFNLTTPSATTAAQAEALKNGYSGSGVVPIQVTSNPRELDVSITTQVPTFFSRIFGITSFTVSRYSKAIFVQPVPMGSPLNYYGVFGPYKDNNVSTPITGPSGEALIAAGFWGSTLTQGAGSASGDAYMPIHDKAAGSGNNPNGQDTKNYHNYSVYMPPGSSGGRVWIFDPVFCDTDGTQGTGENWIDNNYAGVYTKYELYNTNNMPYDLTAQTPLGSSASLFSNMSYNDSSEGGSGGSACTPSPVTNQNDPRYWHNKWWELTGSQGANQQLSGGADGRTYRVHVTTDPGDTSQDNVNATNNYAIFASASGGSPEVYGSGSMQMYTPLPKNQTSTFYMAQIDQQAGAGKTIEINLWDPGDTGNLTAVMSVLQPTATGWSAVPDMNWTAVPWGAEAKCSTGAHGGPTAGITTSAGGTSYFNSCWLKISIAVHSDYTAPQGGWWKIQYAMTGGTSPSATDETTWQVNIRGNPVHLI
jgi:hypothetical protein